MCFFRPASDEKDLGKVGSYKALHRLWRKKYYERVRLGSPGVLSIMSGSKLGNGFEKTYGK
jgi:hypothetical protein